MSDKWRKIAARRHNDQKRLRETASHNKTIKPLKSHKVTVTTKVPKSRKTINHKIRTYRALPYRADERRAMEILQIIVMKEFFIEMNFIRSVSSKTSKHGIYIYYTENKTLLEDLLLSYICVKNNTVENIFKLQVPGALRTQIKKRY